MGADVEGALAGGRPSEANRTAPPEEQVPTLVRIDWRDHVPIFGAAATFLFIIVEAYGVGDFDIPTALALIESAGATHILLGTLLGFLPYLLPLVFFLAAWAALKLRRRRAAWGSQGMVWALALVAGALSAWRFALVTGAVMAVYALIVVFVTRATDRRPGFRLRSDQEGAPGRSPLGPAALIALGGFFLISLTTPWVPTELVRVEGPSVAALSPNDGFKRRSDSVEGVVFVIKGDQGGWATLLTDRNRRTVRVRSKDLVAREVCRRAVPVPRESIAQLLFSHTHHSQTPACPSEAPT